MALADIARERSYPEKMRVVIGNDQTQVLRKMANINDRFNGHATPLEDGGDVRGLVLTPPKRQAKKRLQLTLTYNKSR